MPDDSGPSAALPGPAGTALTATGQRYESAPPTPEGTPGRDRLLERLVTVSHAAGPQAAELERLARLLGRLDHAGIGPLIDLSVDADGATLVCRDVGGFTLAEALPRLAAGDPPPELATPTAVITVFLRLCDLVACAHARRVVHHAIAPERIRLGVFGQVVLDGWQAAEVAQASPATRRFVGASSASGDALALDGLHEDVCALGRCLYLALTGEAPPVTAAGTLGEPDVAARSRLPSPLLAVVRRALASGADGAGYPDVPALAADLTRVLAGQVPQAQVPPAWRLVLAWAGRRRLAVAATLLLLLAGAAGATALAQRRYAELRVWGPPLVEERFQDAGWTARWEPRIPETWTVADGRALTTGLNDASLIYKRRLTPPVAIEYTAQVTRGAKVGDLSLWWCEEPGFLENQRLRPYSSKGWMFQLGAYENTYASITRQPVGRPVAMSSLKLVPERDYRVRVEIEERDYRVFVDGALVMQHRDLLPAGTGYICLFGYFPGKAFDDVRIHQRELPPLVSPLAVGDGAYQDGRFADAAAHYGRVVESARDPHLVAEALFRQGLAERRGGDPFRSLETWRRIADPALREVADCLLLEDQIAGAEHGQALERFRWFWRNRPAVRPVLATQWVELSDRMMKRGELPLAERMRWYDLREELFPGEPVSALSAAQMLIVAGRSEEVLTRFPDDYRACGTIMLGSGREEELLQKPWANSRERGQALYHLGRLEEAAADRSLYLEMQALSLVKLGRLDEALEQSWSRPWGLLFSGRAAELLEQEGVATGLQNATLIAAGRLAEAAGEGLPIFRRSGRSATAAVLLGGLAAARSSPDPLLAAMGALAQGDATAAREARGRIPPPRLHGWRDQPLSAALLLPLIERELGQPEALRPAYAALAAAEDRHWAGLTRLIAAAILDPAAEPALAATIWRSEAKAWLAIARALRSELVGDRAAARAAWTAFRELPVHERLLMDAEPSPYLETAAAWRAQAP